MSHTFGLKPIKSQAASGLWFYGRTGERRDVLAQAQLKRCAIAVFHVICC